MGCLRNWFVSVCSLLVLLLAACGGGGDNNGGKNNSDVECTSNADCEGGVCDLATNTCQGGANNTETNNAGTNNAGTNNNTGTNNTNTGTNGATCGDGVVEGNETCDGDCPTECDDGDACTVGTLEGLAENCSAVCTFSDVTACSNGDGCCPDGCTPDDDDDCMAMCGDGVLDPGENCDFGINGGEGTCPVGPADCNDSEACTIDAVTGDAGMCTAMCVNEPIVTCEDDDGCCPGACDVTTDNDCMPKVGQPCTADAECPATVEPGFCMTEADWRWPGGFCTGGCNSDADCTADSHCNGRVCVPDCTNNDDCRAGYQCYDFWGTGQNTCAPTPGTAENTGGACTADTDCLGSLFGAECLDDASLPGGYCLSGCEVDQDCAAGSHCATLSTGGQACLPDCMDDTECRQGYECFDWFGDFDNTCGPVANGMGAVGDACTVLQDCAGGQDGVCIDSPNWDGGYCALSGCMDDMDCAAGSHCGFIDPASAEGLCLKDCTDAMDCRTNYSCVDSDEDGSTECAPSGSGTGAIGDPCTGVFECSGGVDAFCIQQTSNWYAGYCSLSCTADADCGADAHCGYVDPNTGEGACVANCVDDTECRDMGYACFDSDQSADGSLECAPAGTGMGATGDACVGVWECGGDDGAFCLQDASGWPDGYCADSGCMVDADCTAGGHCGFVNADGEGVCLDSCGTDADCRADYGCFDLDQDVNTECLPVGDGDVGDPCRSFVDCAGRDDAACIADSGGWPGGYCLLDCDATTGTMCPAGSTCVTFGVGQSFCLVACQMDSECRAGYTCQMVDALGTMACAPPPP